MMDEISAASKGLFSIEFSVGSIGYLTRYDGSFNEALGWLGVSAHLVELPGSRNTPGVHPRPKRGRTPPAEF